MPIIFDHVYHTYSVKSPVEYAALKDISLSIKDHSFTALIGQTGSGKSTLAQHINALLIPTQGSVDVNGFLINNGKKKIKKIKDLRKKVGLVFQFPEYQLFEETVLKDVLFGPKNFGVDEQEALRNAKEALNLVSIPERYWDKSPFELSGGQRRRVAIAGIITLRPEILILDEPTAGLDPKGAQEMMDLFKEIHKQGTTIVMVSHDMNNVLTYCSDVVVLKDGKVSMTGTPIDLFKDDEKLKEFSIEEPIVLSFAKKLIKQGRDICLDNVKDVKSLAEEIKKGKVIHND